MAVISTIFGGLVGFVTFLCTLVLTDASLLQALAYYALAGCAAAGLLIAVSLRRPKAPAATWRDPTAIHGPHQPNADVQATV